MRDAHARSSQRSQEIHVRSSQRYHITDLIKDFLAFMPWQLVILGMTGMLLGLQLEGDMPRELTPLLAAGR